MRLDAVFLAASGEWRLGGFEVLSAPKDETAVLYVSCAFLAPPHPHPPPAACGADARGEKQNMGSLLPDAARFAPPEVKLGGWSPLKE